jgi:leucyl-tRNA synthetase
MQALSYKNTSLNITEPFEGLFTQGMVCHETYKDQNNSWISPDEIEIKDGKKVLKNNPKHQVKVGPSESMSKSKRNTVDPEKIIQIYGADSARLFILSDSPPEKDVQWSDEGIASSHKFLLKLWSLNQKILGEIDKNHLTDSSENLIKFTNKFIKKMTTCLENFSYNILIANLHEMQNFFVKELNNSYTKKTLIENYGNILITMQPIIPHLASECLTKIGIKNNQWPDYNEKMLIEDIIPYVIQINGKKRGLIETNRDISENELVNLIYMQKNITKHINKDKIKKIVYIKNKLMNIIIQND